MAVLLAKGEIRCYCDAPHCVATGYMCKSDRNPCFTKVLDPLSAHSPLTHGCLDPGTDARDVCGGQGEVFAVECCHQDMCNYRGLHDLEHNRDADQGRYPPESNNRHLVTRVQELASTKEVWFRAAVIAVPIAGGLILVLLIMLALRMLRSENKRLQDQRQQMLSRLHYSFHGHHTKKSHRAKLDLECMVPVTGHENCCLTCDKMRQVDLGNEKILSLVHWGMYSGHGRLEFV